ncbi:MAG: DUF3313 domain-containing protein [Betaproteobacteria bacterium]|nr:DUF3313 domain-containing protein [Betaproteobacteria bacterium]
MRIDRWVVAVSAAVFLLAGPVVAQDKGAKSMQSGFLGDGYSRLKDAESASGQKVKRWVAPEMKAGSYEFILIEPNIFYPQPRSTEQMSEQTLKEINAYFDEAARRELTGLFQFAKEPGPKTLRLKTAITAVAAKDMGLKPYQLLPIAFIATGGKTSKQASLAAEYEALDADTGKVVAIGMREGVGVELKSATEKLTLAHVKPVIDTWAKDVRAFVEAARQKK